MVFDHFRGSIAATKVSNAIMAACAHLVNFLITGGFRVQLADTARILTELHCFARFGYQVLHRGDSDKKIGAFVVLVKDNLSQLLEQLWSQGIPVEMIRADNTVGTVIDGLDDSYREWMETLAAAHPDKSSKSNQDWLARGMAQAWDNIGYYLHEQYNDPDRAGETGVIHEKQIFAEIRKNVLTLAGKSR